MNTFMKKTILANNISNARRYVTREAFYNNNVVNYDLDTPKTLVNSLIDLNIRMISDKEASYIMHKIIKNKEDGYGLKEYALTVGATAKLLEVINDYRLSSKEDYKYILNGKYESLLDDYRSYLNKHNLTDYIYGLDYIRDKQLDQTLYLLNDLNLSKKEIDAISKVFKETKVIDINKKEYKIKNAYSCYGVYNELLNVLDIIEKNNYPISDCEVVYTSKIYENLIRGLLDSRGINYSITNAKAKSTNYISFMLDILNYLKSNFRYELLEVALKNKGIENVYLKEFYDTLSFPKVVIGFGRNRTLEFLETIKDDESKTNIFNFLSDLIEVFDDAFYYEKFLEFTNKYIKSVSEKKALFNKLDNLKYIINIVDDNEKMDVAIREISQIVYDEADDNSILVTPLDKRFSLKNNLFIIGLSQNYITGSNIENPFIVDIDNYANHLDNEKYLHILKNTRGNMVDALNYYLDYSISNNIYLSYASYNKIDIRPSAPSVFFIEKTKGLNIEEVNKYDISTKNIHFKTIDYSNVNVSEIDEAYDNGKIKEVIDQKNHVDEIKDIVIKDKKEEENKPVVFSLSPSSLKDMLKCPFLFYYKNLKKLPNPSYPKLNEYEWLEANSRGTFFHNVLDEYAKKALKEGNFKDSISNSDFIDCFNIAVNKAEGRNVTKNTTIHDKELSDMKNLTMQYIKDTILKFKDEKYRVLETEYKLYNTKASYTKNNISIIFSGDVDRIDGYLDKDVLHLRIIDYKTGKFKDKKEIEYVQHIIYPYALKEAKVKLFGLDYKEICVDCFIYDFIDENKSLEYSNAEIFDSPEAKDIFSNIDSMLIGYLANNDVLDTFNEYFDSNTKILTSDYRRSVCEYCTYKENCIKRLKEGIEWEKITKKN